MRPPVHSRTHSTGVIGDDAWPQYPAHRAGCRWDGQAAFSAPAHDNEAAIGAPLEGASGSTASPPSLTCPFNIRPRTRDSRLKSGHNPAREASLFFIDICHLFQAIEMQRISLSEGRLRPRVLLKVERVRCPRAERYTPFPGGFGHHLAGTMTGPGGAFPGLGQAGAGNARGRAQESVFPGWSARTG